MVLLTSSVHYLGRARGSLIASNQNGNKKSAGVFDPIPLLELGILKENLEDLLTVKNLERNTPFRRFSPELFTKVLSACDSPSLATAMSICRAWRKSILTTSKLFLTSE